VGDLDHHVPLRSATTLGSSSADGRSFSLFAAFFRVDSSEDASTGRGYQHFLIWGLVDPDRGRYFSHTLLDPRSADQGLHETDRGRGPRDERFARALREVLSEGRIPLPDRVLDRGARVDLDRLALDYDGNLFLRRDDGPYELTLQSEAGGEGCRLRFTLEKPVVRHGDNGLVRGVDGEDMFYGSSSAMASASSTARTTFFPRSAGRRAAPSTRSFPNIPRASRRWA
jgi:hypothetical protein